MKQSCAGLLTNPGCHGYTRSVEEVTIHEAKTHLSRLLKRVEAGESLLIKRGDVPVARLVPVEAELPPREWGQWEGQISLADDFDDPLPDEILRFFNE